MGSIPLHSFVEDLEKIEASHRNLISEAANKESIERIRIELFGKKGALTEQMKNLRFLENADKAEAGKKANEVRELLSRLFEEKSKRILEGQKEERLRQERIDVSLPAHPVEHSHSHPIQFVQDEIVTIFEHTGFVVEIGPELEHTFYNFDALNMPENHPARRMQDTFYVKDHPELVLRTHTSPVQIRTMLAQKPPIRMISPGRVYRSDYDPTHSPMFHQIEGLLVDQDVFMGDLKGILEHMIREFFGASLRVRLRPSFFPFTEPSAEFDMECAFCKGAGCRVCKKTGWIEIGGCGMVDPEVFKSVDYEIGKYRAFAFGMGIERMAMLKYGINDIRAFYESDYRFISQFSRWSQ